MNNFVMTYVFVYKLLSKGILNYYLDARKFQFEVNDIMTTNDEKVHAFKNHFPLNASKYESIFNIFNCRKKSLT